MVLKRRPNVAGATDVGKVRFHNEDTFLVRRDLGLFLVADGMGGAQAGDIASAMARLSIGNFFDATSHEEEWDAPRSGQTEDGPPLPREAQRLVAAVEKANSDIHSIASTKAEQFGMGSTVVALLELGDQEVCIAHVGDSRCYRVRGDKIELLTSDHSLLNEARAMDPTLTEEELSALPANIITRALGVSEHVMVDARIESVEEGDIFVLCSDGLNGEISDEEIRSAVRLAKVPTEACDVLVALANAAGGNDNVTALIVACS